MKYEVFYNAMGVMPVHNYFETKEKAQEFMDKVKSLGFSPELIEL